MQRARADSRERAGGGNRQEFLFWFSELYVAFICRSRPVPLLLGRGWCGGAVEALFAVGDWPRGVRQESKVSLDARNRVSEYWRVGLELYSTEVHDAGPVTNLKLV